MEEKNVLSEEQKKIYIELKLQGCVDSKEELFKKFNLDKDKNIGTIGKYIRNRFSITEENYELLQENEGREIQHIKSLYNNDERKSGFKTLLRFYNWYKKESVPLKTCCYCGVKESNLKKYFNEENIQYVEARQRGKVLEIERVVTAPKSKNLYTEENCKLACYVCNNAKSDFISPANFKPIAKGISEFWKENGIEVEFPNNSTIWNK